MTPTKSEVSRSPYRPIKQITDELRDHCNIYFDEQLYINALTLLSDIVTAGSSHPDFLNQPGIAPLPFHIELVGALLIHPRHTTQAPRGEQLALPSRAITLLRNILAILGPLNANLKEAFCFTPPNPSRGRRSRHSDDGDSESEDRAAHMNGIIAKGGRIRNCARDIWHVVGWAFNCSVRYPKRWKYWKVWLEYMFDVLDADWKERERQDLLGEEESFAMRQESILAMYFEDVKGRSTAVKRVVRSMFADGGVESLREFKEVFPNETRDPPSKSSKKRKRETPAEDSFGDYDSDEGVLDSLEFPDAAPLEEDDAASAAVDEWLGGTESIALRQRGLALLSSFAFYLPDDFASCSDIYSLIYSLTKPLPLPAFSILFSSSPSNKIPEAAFVSLTQFILSYLLPPSAPNPLDSRHGDDLSEEVLEKFLLPFPAVTTSVNDNAKVSILVESLFRLLVGHFRGQCNAGSLKGAVEMGIATREKKVKGDQRKNYVKVKDYARDLLYLKASGLRMRALILQLERKEEGDEIVALN